MAGVTDKSEKAIEEIIEAHLMNVQGYTKLVSNDYSKEYGVCDKVLEQFLIRTQPQKVANTMCFSSPSERNKFFTRLREEITKRGITDVLRKGYRYISEIFDLYYPLPSELNSSAKKDYAGNEFAVMRQLHFSKADPELSVDMVVFINGLPIMTLELKNHYTGQTIENAKKQYSDRDAKELLFMPKRCAVHFAVDDTDISMCTWLCGADSWFLPFNKGVNGGAGNPVNPNGLKTAYLWEDVLEKQSLSNILENFAQVTVEKKKDKKTGKEKTIEKNIWPRYHQLQVVRALLTDTQKNGVGNRYLIQHSAGSGKSNSITWLAYQLVELKNGVNNIFDSIIVVTDRVNLDRQIRDNIVSFKRLASLVGWAEDSATLFENLDLGKKIIITTVHKFPHILKAISGEGKNSKLANGKFAIIIDEAHSSQNGSMSAMMNVALAGKVGEDEDDIEDAINKMIEGRKMLSNANYYAFTATPKNKTLQMFGSPFDSVDEDGNPVTAYRPFHEYTMKQAIEEGFIMDVLKCYTPFTSYYTILKTVEENPEYDKKQASKKLRAFVESQPETLEEKALIIVNHFHDKVFKKVGGKARAMVVCSSIERAILYYYKIKELLEARHSPYKAIIAFSGKKEYLGKEVDESTINGFPSAQIEEKMEEEPYRLLIVADKFQTGYDQPLLHTMYVDKHLTDVKAVQTLSRLNRCHPKKIDTFVLDFFNDPEDIQKSFQKYYKATILKKETDPNKLNDLISEIEAANIYTDKDVDDVADLYFNGESREKIDPIIDYCVQRFKLREEDVQISCKSAMRNFIRIYPFLAAVIPQKSAYWEKLYTFYDFLIHKLPKLKGEDWAKDILDKIDFDKYRLIRKEEMSIKLEDSNQDIDPVPVGGSTTIHQPEFVELDSIINEFNELYGGIDWQNPEKVKEQIRELPTRLAQNEDFANAALNGDIDNAELECNSVLQVIIAKMLAENTEFARNYMENLNFQAFVNTRVFSQAYKQVNG